MKLSDRQKRTVENLNSLDSGADFFWDSEASTVKFIKGTLSKASKDKPDKIARDFLQDISGLLDVQDNLTESLDISYIEKDNQDFSHVYFAQSLNGIPVFEGSTQVHINPAGEVIAYKDYRLATLDVSLTPRITEQNVIEVVNNDRGKDSKPLAKSKTRLILFRDNEKQTHLAWEVEWIAEDQMAVSLHIVDAHSGDILLKHSRIRGAVSRLTYSAENSENLKAKLMVTDSESTSDNVAQAAHDHAKTVYDFYKIKFGRDSYDGRGADIVSTVHFKKNYNNAYWTDWHGQMVYGDGDGRTFAPLALALDIVGHELTHAVTSRTARFVYAEEAGALDESFADYFGVMVSNQGDITDWKMGEGVYTPFRSGDALRDLSNPSQHDQPDHMNDFLELAPGEQPDSNKNDNGYVHSNSGIPNKAAYLSVAGGSHHGINVRGIGRDKAEQVYYLAMTSYLSSATDSRWTFMQARYAILNACRQLYGDSGSEYAALKNAWAAVGVGEPANTFGILRNDVSPNLPIPDNDATGIESVLRIDEEGLLKDINIGIAIEHTYIGDLRVVLKSPAGESVILHDRRGGSRHDLVETYNFDSYPALNTFAGDTVQGDWILSVSDNAKVDTGKLLFWELDFSIEKVEKKEVSKEVNPNEAIPDNNLDGVVSKIEIQKAGKIVRMDIKVDISHTWIGDLRVILTSPSGIEVVLHDLSGRSRHDIKRTYTTTADQTMQTLVGEEINGSWLLKVIDSVSRDIGTLNSWGIHCVYE